METIFIVIGALFIVAGIFGAFLPIIPGPPLSFIGILILHFAKGDVFGWLFLGSWGVVVVLVATLDGFMPAEGARRMGGSKLGIYGALIGALLGLFFFPPAGILIGPIVGAFIGEMVAGKRSGSALRSAMGSFVGYLVATGMKVGVAVILAYYFAVNM
ncbi:MAG TPA: DUF456 domain-containing protein [Balneolaceae bacterium]|nr:DUF456 domain-containing protein [Balneolaceae bacterium]